MYTIAYQIIPIHFLALTNSAFKKVTLSSGVNKAEFAVDGLVEGPCSVTEENAAHPWWSVDLRGRYRVAEVHFLRGPSGK